MQKNSVASIAKRFGKQTNSKKAITKGSTKDNISYNETLRIARNNLKNVKEIVDDAITRQQTKPITTQSQIYTICETKPATDGQYNDININIDNSDTDDNETASIGDNYESSSTRRSSVISSISSSSSSSDEWPEFDHEAKIIISSGDDKYYLYDSDNNLANGNENNDSKCLYDYADTDDDDEEEHKKQFKRKRELEIATDLDALFPSDDSDNITYTEVSGPSCMVEFNMGHMGALTMRDFMSNKNESVNVSTKDIDIFAGDQYYIDSEDEYCSSGSYMNDEYEMTIDVLLSMFGLLSDAQVCNYLCDALGIKYTYQMVDILPQTITNPMHYKQLRIGQVKKINKMVKWISDEVDKNIYDGEKRNEWIGVQNNSFHKIFQEKSSISLQWNDKEDLDDVEYTEIVLNGSTNATTMNILDMMDRECSVTLVVEQLPSANILEQSLFTMGFDVSGIDEKHSLRISDRLVIRSDDMYVGNVFLGKFVENESRIVSRLKLSENRKCLNVRFSHQPKYGQRTKSDDKQYTKNIDINLNENVHEVNISITQFSGNGKYKVNIE